MDLMTALFASQLNGDNAELPSVDNADNGKILQVKNGKWGKGDNPLESIYANDFAEHFDEYALKDVVYFVDGTVEPYTRFNESIDSQEAAQNKVYAGPVNPSVVIIGYEPWHAFSDNAEHGFSTVYDESDGSYLQYVFEYPQHVRAISFKLKYETNLDEPPTIPVELYIELHDGHKGWKDRTLIFRGNIDEDFEFMWYAPTSNPLGITDSIRFINTSPLSDNSTYVVSIANIQLFDASSELYTGDKSIWYKGEKFSNISEGGGSGGGPTRVCLYQATDYEHAKLWSSDNWNNTSTWITLADGHTIDEFDEIQIVSMTSEGDQPSVHRYDNLVTYIVNTEDLVPQVGTLDNVKARIFWQSKQSGQQRDCDLTFSQDLTKVHPASVPAWYVIIYAIYGIKY